MSNLTNPEVLRAMTPAERDEAAIRISGLIEALRAMRWVAQAMTPGGCEGPAPDPACDQPDGAGPDWPALVAMAEEAIADATDGGLACLFPIRMVKGEASIMVGDAIAADACLAKGFRVPMLDPAANFYPHAPAPKAIRICGNCQARQTDPDRRPCLCDEGFLMPEDGAAAADPIPSDPLSPEYYAWSVRRRVRDGDVEAAVAMAARLRTEANDLEARANAAVKALSGCVDARTLGSGRIGELFAAATRRI